MRPDVQPDELRLVFRANFKRARLRLGLNQTELAEKLGVAQSYISDLESGNKAPLVPTLAELAEALETTPAKLITPQAEKKVAVSAR
jgi:transcriptional regulator with XRE-family HTH domain